MTEPARAPSVYDEFERDLAGWAERFRDRPDDETRHLLLLALEREQIVATAYREEKMAARLETLPLSASLRALIRHALVWVWTDEEMHAIYLRGALRKVGGAGLKLRAFVQQLSGAIGGWSSAVRQHLTWRQAPVSRFWATVFTGLGRLVGRVPRAVVRELEYVSFRQFAGYSVEAERTAALCWERLVELSRTHPFPSSLTDELERMRVDEERHAKLFEQLAQGLDDRDVLRPGLTEASVTASFLEIDATYVPRSLRPDDGNPLGRGGEVHVAHGARVEDGPRELSGLLDRIGLAALVSERARATGKSISSLRVAIKISFMYAPRHDERSTMTDPSLVAGLIASLSSLGCERVCLLESQNLYDWYFDGRTVAEVARYFELDRLDVPVVDATLDQVPHTYRRGLAQHSVSRAWSEADLRISFGKLKSHPVEQVYLSLGNLEGLGARCDEFLFSERQAERDHAAMALAWDFPPHLGLLDGYAQAADGIVGMLGCRSPRVPLRLYAGRDALAVDQVAARHLGLGEVTRSPMLHTAVRWFGDPREGTRVVGDDSAISPWTHPLHNELSAVLSLLANPFFSIASGRGALFTSAFDTSAFTPKHRAGLALRAARYGIKTLLALPR